MTDRTLRQVSHLGIGVEHIDDPIESKYDRLYQLYSEGIPFLNNTIEKGEVVIVGLIRPRTIDNVD